MDIILLVLWSMLGALNLIARKEINKFDYAVCWIVLMLHLIINCIE